MGDDPAFLQIGTEVSAKYKGAFCEAKVKTVNKNVKIRVQFKFGLGSAVLSDEQIRGNISLNCSVEAQHPDNSQYHEAIIIKVQDQSHYTVVFDDGDITTLRRSALVLKSGRHFAQGESLDQLPLTHPEHFGTPVGSSRRRGRRDESSDEDEDKPKNKRTTLCKEPNIGKVVAVEIGDKKKSKDNWFPGLVVAPTAQDAVTIKVKEDYLVRSFQDGRYYTVPKKEASEFSRIQGAKAHNEGLKQAVEKATQYIDNNSLPAHWDRELLFKQQGSDSSSEESSDEESTEEKDRFVAQLFKFMDDRGTPINKCPTIGSNDLDLYRLFKVVHRYGGYNKVNNNSMWKAVFDKMLVVKPVTNGQNVVRQAYKKYLKDFDELNRKLGCTMVNSPRSVKKKQYNRSLIRDKDKQSAGKSVSTRRKLEEKAEETEIKKEPEKRVSKREERSVKVKEEKTSITPEPRVTTTRSKSKELSPDKRATRSEINKETAKTESPTKEKEAEGERKRHNTGVKVEETELPIRRQRRDTSSRPDNQILDSDESDSESVLPQDVDMKVGDRLKVFYTPSKDMKITYDAKVLEVEDNGSHCRYFVHYAGWNSRHDEWIRRARVAENQNWSPSRKKQKLEKEKGKEKSSTVESKRKSLTKEKTKKELDPELESTTSKETTTAQKPALRRMLSRTSKESSVDPEVHSRSNTPNSVSSMTRSRSPMGGKSPVRTRQGRTNSPRPPTRATRAAAASTSPFAGGLQLRTRTRKTSEATTVTQDEDSESESEEPAVRQTRSGRLSDPEKPKSIVDSPRRRSSRRDNKQPSDTQREDTNSEATVTTASKPVEVKTETMDVYDFCEPEPFNEPIAHVKKEEVSTVERKTRQQKGTCNDEQQQEEKETVQCRLNSDELFDKLRTIEKPVVEEPSVIPIQVDDDSDEREVSDDDRSDKTRRTRRRKTRKSRQFVVSDDSEEEPDNKKRRQDEDSLLCDEGDIPHSPVREQRHASFPNTQPQQQRPVYEAPAPRPIQRPMLLPSSSRYQGLSAAIVDNTPPTTPESSMSSNSPPLRGTSSISPPDDDSKSNSSELDLDSDKRDSTNQGNSSSSDAKKSSTKRGTDTDDTVERRVKRKTRSVANRQLYTSGKSPQSTGTEESMEKTVFTPTLPTKPSKYNFYVTLGSEMDAGQRINLLQHKITELRKVYQDLKQQVASIDRRRKRLRRKEKDEQERTKEAETAKCSSPSLATNNNGSSKEQQPECTV